MREWSEWGAGNWCNSLGHGLLTFPLFLGILTACRSLSKVEECVWVRGRFIEEVGSIGFCSLIQKLGGVSDAVAAAG